jgi:hypothetical protein
MSSPMMTNFQRMIKQSLLSGRKRGNEGVYLLDFGSKEKMLSSKKFDREICDLSDFF